MEMVAYPVKVGSINKLFYNPDGSRLIVTGNAATEILLFGSDGKPSWSKFRLEGATCSAINESGGLIFFGQNGLYIWDTIRNQYLGKLLSIPPTRISCMAYCEKEKYLATGGTDGKIIVWDTDLESWKSIACSQIKRNFSRDEWERYFDDDPYKKTCPELPEAEEIKAFKAFFPN